MNLLRATPVISTNAIRATATFRFVITKVHARKSGVWTLARLCCSARALERALGAELRLAETRAGDSALRKTYEIRIFSRDPVATERQARKLPPESAKGSRHGSNGRIISTQARGTSLLLLAGELGRLRLGTDSQTVPQLHGFCGKRMPLCTAPLLRRTDRKFSASYRVPNKKSGLSPANFASGLRRTPQKVGFVRARRKFSRTLLDA